MAGGDLGLVVVFALVAFFGGELVPPLLWVVLLDDLGAATGRRHCIMVPSSNTGFWRRPGRTRCAGCRARFARLSGGC